MMEDVIEACGYPALVFPLVGGALIVDMAG
jgi:hypothetical protein